MAGNPLRIPIDTVADWRQSPAWREAFSQLEALAWKEILDLYGEMAAYRLGEPAVTLTATAALAMNGKQRADGSRASILSGHGQFDGAALSALETLSPRETDVFPFIVAGASNKVIALELGMSQRTVEAHRARIFAKMGVRNAVELVRRATACALVQGPSSRFWQLMGVVSSSS